VVFARWPVLGEFREELSRGGAALALLSGSGSTVFGVFDDPGALREASARLVSRFGSWRLLESRTVACGASVDEAGWAD
jgi:4-diphosphocytidyl-2-C-methyl-D-erythritol kinase